MFVHKVQIPKQNNFLFTFYIYICVIWRLTSEANQSSFKGRQVLHPILCRNNLDLDLKVSEMETGLTGLRAEKLIITDFRKSVVQTTL